MREFTEQEQVRREKLKNIKNPYPERYEINTEIKDAINLPDETTGIRVAGRIVLMRKMGKMSFLTIGDIGGRIQISVKMDMIGEDAYCNDVLVQLSAIENSVKSLSNHILENHLYSCVTRDLENGKLEIIDELISLFKKFNK